MANIIEAGNPSMENRLALWKKRYEALLSIRTEREIKNAVEAFTSQHYPPKNRTKLLSMFDFAADIHRQGPPRSNGADFITHPAIVFMMAENPTLIGGTERLLHDTVEDHQPLTLTDVRAALLLNDYPQAETEKITSGVNLLSRVGKFPNKNGNLILVKHSPLAYLTQLNSHFEANPDSEELSTKVDDTTHNVWTDIFRLLTKDPTINPTKLITYFYEKTQTTLTLGKIHKAHNIGQLEEAAIMYEYLLLKTYPTEMATYKEKLEEKAWETRQEPSAQKPIVVFTTSHARV